MKIKAHDSSEWYLIEVISLILQHLKDELERNLQMCEPGLDGTRLKATDFDWVITVPAIWQARGKGMMREAGNMVRLHISYDKYINFQFSACLKNFSVLNYTLFSSEWVY